jgi:SAM-dependent methyltransferase
MKSSLNLDNLDAKMFYLFQGRLATKPIIEFLRLNGENLKGILIDFGCGSMPYKKFFPNVSKYIGVDLYNDLADLNEDIKSTSFPDEFANIVLCNQVIEHDTDPDGIIAEAYRVLKTKGVLLLSAPQMGRLHGEPNDFFRYTKYGLRYLLEKNGFSVISIKPHGGFFRAFGSHLNFFLLEKFGGRKNVLKVFISISFINFNNLFFSLLDKIIYWDKDTLGYNIIAKKDGRKSTS